MVPSAFERSLKLSLCLMLAVTTGMFSLAAPVSAQSKDPIKLGVLLPFTGNAAALARASIAGVKLAVEEINRAGGIAGRQIETVTGDDQNDPTQGVNEAIRLVKSAKVDLLVGAPNSQIALAIQPTLKEGKVAGATYMGSNLLTPEAAPYMFSMLPSSDSQTRAIVKYTREVVKAKNIALLVDNSGFSKAFEETAQRFIKDAGGTVVGSQEYAMNSPDVVPQLLSLRRANPEVIVNSSVIAADLAHVLQGLSSIGWDIKFVGGLAVSGFAPSVVKIAGPDAYKNAVGLQLLNYTYCANDAPGIGDTGKFLAKLRASDPQAYAGGSLSNAGAMYDAVYIFKAAIEANGGKTDGATIANWIETSAKSMKGLVTGHPAPAKGSRFMFDENALAMVQQPQNVRSDGLHRRAGC